MREEEGETKRGRRREGNKTQLSNLLPPKTSASQQTTQ